MVATALLAVAVVHPGIFFPFLRKQKRGHADVEGRTEHAMTDTKGGESSTDESEPVAAK